MRVTHHPSINPVPVNRESVVQQAVSSATPSVQKVVQKRASPVQTENSGDFKLLSAARHAMHNASEFDTDKVEEIRAALLQGSIRFNPDKLTDAILRYHGGALE